MPLFIRGRDFRLFQHFNQEIIDYVIDARVIVRKVDVINTETNIYGESDSGKMYTNPIVLPALIAHDEQSTETEEFGPTILQNVTIAFQRERIRIKNFYPENGDLIEWNDSFFEIGEVVENELLGSQYYWNHSIICRTAMVSRDKLNLEDVRPGKDE